jgi:hypothetical protein
LTFGSIKGTNVLVHYYHDVPILDNHAIVSNHFDMVKNALIDVYILGVPNPKGCVHSQPHTHFQLKQYKEPS